MCEAKSLELPTNFKDQLINQNASIELTPKEFTHYKNGKV